MPLESSRELTQHAYRNGYGIGYFESWNLESLQGVVDAAEKTRSPIIIGFNGEFLSGSSRDAVENLAWYAALGKAAAESAKVPCGLIFNECPNDDWVLEAIDLGFNLVMPVDAQASYDDYLQRVREIADYAHSHSAAVEAELDELPFGASGHSEVESQYRNAIGTVSSVAIKSAVQTDPQRLAEFVEATQVDLLAVSVGNIHVSLSGEFDIDLERLAELQECVSVPLVLHGGSGIAPDALRVAVKMGVAKVNFGTYLKQQYLVAIRRALASDNQNPHILLGMGSRADVMVAGRNAVRDAVIDRIDLLGCCGRA